MRVLTGAAGAGTMIVGLVPEDVGSGWHFVGALMYFLAGALALLLLGRYGCGRLRWGGSCWCAGWCPSPRWSQAG
ncbi:hypothetical protein AHiyo4_09120 [Arthrobacter sp. Hiyo4]|nr:hypothetical protein AHiyo4_09120 [Arthrobacter sp. Hiyo4]